MVGILNDVLVKELCMYFLSMYDAIGFLPSNLELLVGPLHDKQKTLNCSSMYMYMYI